VGLCPCLKKASAFVADVGGDVSSPARLKTDAVARAAELSTCLVTAGALVGGSRGAWGQRPLGAAGHAHTPAAGASLWQPPTPLLAPPPPPAPGFNVQSNEASQRESFARDAAADVVIEAPKVDTAFYTSLAAAVAGCAAGGGTCDTVPDLFLK
jgi:hypothetical protein